MAIDLRYLGAGIQEAGKLIGDALLKKYILDEENRRELLRQAFEEQLLERQLAHQRELKERELTQQAKQFEETMAVTKAQHAENINEDVAKLGYDNYVRYSWAKKITSGDTKAKDELDKYNQAVAKIYQEGKMPSYVNELPADMQRGLSEIYTNYWFNQLKLVSSLGEDTGKLPTTHVSELTDLKTQYDKLNKELQQVDNELNKLRINMREEEAKGRSGNVSKDAVNRLLGEYSIQIKGLERRRKQIENQLEEIKNRLYGKLELPPDAIEFEQYVSLAETMSPQILQLPPEKRKQAAIIAALKYFISIGKPIPANYRDIAGALGLLNTK